MSSPDVLITVIVGTVVVAGVRILLIEPHRQTQARLIRIERSVDRLLQHFGLQDANALSPQVQELLRQGRKMNAIKAYREETGAGLKEAKDAVERLSP